MGMLGFEKKIPNFKYLFSLCSLEFKVFVKMLVRTLISFNQVLSQLFFSPWLYSWSHSSEFSWHAALIHYFVLMNSLLNLCPKTVTLFICVKPCCFWMTDNSIGAFSKRLFLIVYGLWYQLSSYVNEPFTCVSNEKNLLSSCLPLVGT